MPLMELCSVIMAKEDFSTDYFNAMLGIQSGQIDRLYYGGDDDPN